MSICHVQLPNNFRYFRQEYCSHYLVLIEAVMAQFVDPK